MLQIEGIVKNIIFINFLLKKKKFPNLSNNLYSQKKILGRFARGHEGTYCVARVVSTR